MGTVGGLLGANAFGSLRHRYGTVRDWLIGLQLVHADGTTSKSGGRVVKNVSGYDLHKVHIGALGSLAIIAEATFKLAPLPKADLTIVISCPSASAGASIVRECHERGLILVAAELLSPTASHAVLDQPHWTVLLRIAGGGAAVARTARDIRDLVALADSDLMEVESTAWDRWRSEFASAPLALRMSVPPARVADAAESLDRRFAGDRAAITGTATVGLLRMNATPGSSPHAADILQQVNGLAAARGGHVMIDAAPVPLKQEVDVFGAPREDFSIMRRLKNEFDPTGILAPGRFMGRI